MRKLHVDRRSFIRGGIGASAGLGLGSMPHLQQAAKPTGGVASDDKSYSHRPFNGAYQGPTLQQIAFPMGGMGAGMICLEGTGALAKFSLYHRPELERDRQVFAAIAIKGSQSSARVLEGPVPAWKLRPQFPGPDDLPNTRGLPRFHEAVFEARFPFATVHLRDKQIPLEVTLTGWSPFFPGDADNASLPVVGLEYQFVNQSRRTIDAVFSFSAENFMAEPPQVSPDASSNSADRIQQMPGGFILYGAGTRQRPWHVGFCAAWVDEPTAVVNYAWPLGTAASLWRHLALCEYQARPPLQASPAAGASLFVPLTLGAQEAKALRLYLAWYVPQSDLFQPQSGLKDGNFTSYARPADRYRPWYVSRFSGIHEVAEFWQENYQSLRQRAMLFSRTLYDSTLPPEVMEAVAANLSILKSTTVLRQPDGRLWGWEGTIMESGTDDRTGESGTTTHVWNYAQAIPHLFPELERGLRETEFGCNQDENGLQYCRTPLPIRAVEPGHSLPDGPAADGQLGGIIKVYREWRISGDTSWLRRLWPRVRASLDYCIRTWDPGHRGWIEERHLTTYDSEFWGADSLCTSLYIGALKAATLMGNALADSVARYTELLARAVAQMEGQLFNGDYFYQMTNWKHLHTPFLPQDDLWTEMYTQFPERRDFVKREGPTGQCGNGCLSDGVIGEWLCRVSGMDGILDPGKVASHLTSVHRHNLKADLTAHANFARTAFACGNDAGLLLCTWPKGGRPSVPMEYSDEVWTGVEYQVASHLIFLGKLDAGVEIIRAARRRYDGSVRNPFSEVEAGHWYARAMSSYALLQAFSGARYDAVDNVLYLKPVIKGDFRCFISTATGFGTVGVKDGTPFVEVTYGRIPYQNIDYTPA
jgi:uncharacterized protein (DUF608 family)